jgi:hypothetical protein
MRPALASTVAATVININDSTAMPISVTLSLLTGPLPPVRRSHAPFK